MINKFQQGGKLQNAIMLFVQGLALTLLADPNLVILIAQLNPDALKAAIQTYQLTLDMGQAAQVFQLALLKQVQAAKHGIKLQYLKSLKHQCAEDEELYYYKKGGSVGCGCKKKEDGGKVLEAKCGAVAKFKKMKDGGKGESTAKKITDTIATITGTKQAFDKAKKLKDQKESNYAVGDGTTKSHRFDVKPKESKFKNDYSSKRVKDSEKDYLEGKGDHKYKKGGEVKKDCGGSSIVAKFKALCGAKMKKHLLGGSLNLI